MNPHAAVTVTVTYDVDPHTSQPAVTVTPPVIKVSPGQAIHFRRAGQMAGKLRITFQDKDLFSSSNPQFAVTGAFNEGDGDVHVKSMPRHTTYLCELLDANGNQIARSPYNAGGAVEPVKN